jgi:hypothetical protein
VHRPYALELAQLMLRVFFGEVIRSAKAFNTKPLLFSCVPFNFVFVHGWVIERSRRDRFASGISVSGGKAGGRASTSPSKLDAAIAIGK